MSHKIRAASVEDIPAIIKLHKIVAAIPNGLARTPEEITENYVADFVGKSLRGNYCLVIDHPVKKSEIIVEVHAFKLDPVVYNCMLGNITFAIHPEFHNQGIGRQVLSYLLNEVEKNRPDILRVELNLRENNPAALKLYKSLGFEVEGVMRNRIIDSEGKPSGDVMMAWMNPNYVGK